MPFAPRPAAASRPSLRRLPVLLAAALACGGTDRQGGNFVNMYDNAFNAQVVRVPVGGRVKWINVGKNIHNAVPAIMQTAVKLTALPEVQSAVRIASSRSPLTRISSITRERM